MRKLKKLTVIFSAATVFSAIALMLTGCQGRTLDNVEPNGDTVEVKIKGDNEEPADTVLHAMDDQMLHSLDAETIMTTKI